jgi:glucose-1-phosphate thymidylyltransferase
VGPHVSVGKNSVILKSIVINSIIQENTAIENAMLTASMIGNYATYTNKPDDVSVGDYNVISKND